MSENTFQEDVSAINKRLRELNKEAQDLSVLKKKLIKENAASIAIEKYGDYKFLVKNNTNEEFDILEMVKENDLRFDRSGYGLMAVAYTVDDEHRSYHVARTEEEADQIRVVQRLFKVGDEISEMITNKADITAEQIMEMYDEARRPQLQESEDTKAVSE